MWYGIGIWKILRGEKLSDEDQIPKCGLQSFL